MLTNREYAVKVAEKIEECVIWGIDNKYNCFLTKEQTLKPLKDVLGDCVMDFDPATDPASAMAWETLLQDNGFIITHSMATDKSYYCGLKICRSLSTSWAKYEDSGETPLLALKAASEKFLESEENK